MGGFGGEPGDRHRPTWAGYLRGEMNVSSVLKHLAFRETVRARKTSEGSSLMALSVFITLKYNLAWDERGKGVD
jgi:hypothetical protein